MSRSTRLRKTRLLVNSPQTVVYDALLWLLVKLLSLLHVVFLVFLGSLAAARVSSPCAEFFLIARNIFIFFLVLFRVMRKQTTIKKRVGFGCTRKKGAMSEIDDFLARRLRANKFAMGTTFLCEILIFQAEHRWRGQCFSPDQECWPPAGAPGSKFPSSNFPVLRLQRLRY